MKRTEADGVVVVRGDANGFEQGITVGRHHLTADEPVAAGGTDRGPGPYELLLAALGSCMSMTMGLYARRKRWPLTAVEVRLRHSRVYTKDCVDCETQDVSLDRIDTEVRLEGTLTPEQRSRVLEIGQRCPVHQTLKSEIEITVTGA